ncbi:MAG: GIY-YIG nuclease family protein [Candidatus Binataceae bacterium]
MSHFYVYILASRHGVLYIGITSDFERRLSEHQHGVVEGFTKQHEIKRLVYFERFDDPMNAITRKKQLNAGAETRSWRS